MTRERSSCAGDIAGVVAIAVTYIYFLLYAQFGFVNYLKSYFPDPVFTDRCMGAMGAGGLIFSVLAAVLLRTLSPRRMLAAGFAGCAAAAGSTLLAHSEFTVILVSFLVGAFTGLLTVTLAGSLRTWITSPRFGLHVGFGTGIAYLVCNIPPLFNASPRFQAIFSAAICMIGVACALVPSRALNEGGIWTPQLSSGEFRGWGFASLVAMFFSLVWYDSTAFAAIQLNAEFRAQTWGAPSMMMTLGAVHAVSAVAAGWLIDRRCMRRLLVVAFVLLTLAIQLLRSHAAEAISGPFYVCAVSLYSTALVALPSLHVGSPGLLSVRWRAAILYAVAGWIGSGLGVGVAQHIQSIPHWISLAAGVMLVGSLLLSPLPAARRVIRQYGILALCGVAAVGYYSARPGARMAPPSVAVGREVYRQEGCINCHSQYLRPRTRDIEMWGPYREIDRNERPPMVGNRRQGPDLMNAGLRRSSLWHRQHLIDPASLSPGSMMPSYAHLFRDGDTRGDSLVMYLSSLGAAMQADRIEEIRAWSPSGVHTPPSADRGQLTFERYCFVCHGKAGKADGPLASIFNQPGMDLTKGPFMHVTAGLAPRDESVALARVVKFGIPGLNMPGHEYFTDRDIVDVVAYVRKLAGREQPMP